jgi:hypothetical protein
MLANNIYPPMSIKLGADELLNRENGISFINAGNYYVPPFLSLNYYLLPRWPTLLPIVVGAFIISYLILFIFNNFQSRALKIILSFFIAFLPSTLFIITSNPEITLMIVLFSLTMYFILEFAINERVFFLFMAALTFGLQFYIMFEIIWLVILIAGYFAIVYARRKQHINFIITISFPIIFFLLSWFFLMWIFEVDISEFIRENLLLNFNMGIATFDKYLSQNIFLRLPILLLYIYILFSVGKFKQFYKSPLFLAFISPIMMVLLLSIGYFHVNTSFFTSLFMINIIILFPYLGPLFNENRNKHIIILFIVFIFVFDVYSALNLRLNEEKDFFSALKNEYVSEEIVEYKVVAKELEGFEQILTESDETYGVIYFYYGEGEFLTTKTPDHINISLNPQKYADALLFHRYKTDYITYDKKKLYEYYEEIPFYESENFLIFNRKDGE